MNRTQTAERDAYSIQELADRYGVHRTTIWREIWDGKLSTFKLRGKTLISRQSVDIWRIDMRTRRQRRRTRK